MYAGVGSTIYSRTRSMLEMSSSPQQFNRGSRPSAPPPPINQFIRADRVRLIVPGNDTGDEVMLGIFSLADALTEAEKFQMDLVMINDKGDPPVCKVIDYGKYKYSLEKKKKENLKKQVNVDIKEVKMSYKIDQHDFDVRMRAVRKFLADGDKVRDSSHWSADRHLEIEIGSLIGSSNYPNRWIIATIAMRRPWEQEIYLVIIYQYLLTAPFALSLYQFRR